MKIGVVYPQTEYGDDPQAIRDYAQTAEDLGYNHILAYDHVLGVNPERSGGWNGPYTYKTPFQSPFLLFSFMAAVTRKLRFTTGIIILPQRQTALVAKQAATLDVLSAGRLRLGVGIGWNEVEYMALSENFTNRGRRIEEQVSLMRELWTQPLVNFSGQWHHIPDAGLNPLPVQRPIPIWFGGHAEPVLRRVGTIGDGWMPNYRSAQEARPELGKVYRYMDEAGRDNSSLGVEAKLHINEDNRHTWENIVRDWEELGTTHLSINTMKNGFQKPAQHLEALQEFASTIQINSQ